MGTPIQYSTTKKAYTLDISLIGLRSIDSLKPLPDILHLYAFKNNLGSVEGLRHFANLVVIDLHNNQISCVAGAFTSMRGLKELRLDKNDLKSILPEDVQSCSNLTYLNVGFNKLDNVNLTHLYMSENKIENIKDPLANLIHLIAVDFANNCINSLIGLGACEHLKHVNFAGNGVDSLVSAALAFPNSEYLNFSRNRIKYPDEILTALNYLACLKTLAIYENPLEFSDSTVSQVEFEGIIEQFKSGASPVNILTHFYPREFSGVPKNALRPDVTDGEIIEDIETRFLSLEELGDLFTKRIVGCRFQEVLAELPGESLWFDPCDRSSPSVSSDKKLPGSRNRLQDALDFARTAGSNEATKLGNRGNED
uniref:Protein phosphatase 1 regulatory subunit 7 n=1 Tax=Echinococcus granulosus TaxID=6210 RepID=A0A068WI43_ECHGR|nr:protein phosphatase 1 regulatory subunit 7 [Echinococcus granulosus]